MRRTLLTLLAVLTALTLGLLATAGQASMTREADLTIRQQTVGCHDWSLNNGSFKLVQRLLVHEGESFTVTNRDMCGHRLVQTGGSDSVLMQRAGTPGTTSDGALAPVGKGVRMSLLAPGTYTFTTLEDDGLVYGVKEADEYFGRGRLRTTGTDNVLTLEVKVLPDVNGGTDGS